MRRNLEIRKSGRGIDARTVELLLLTKIPEVASMNADHGIFIKNRTDLSNADILKFKLDARKQRPRSLS